MAGLATGIPSGDQRGKMYPQIVIVSTFAEVFPRAIPAHASQHPRQTV